MSKIDVTRKKKVAFKMLGGGVPNVGFQLGVCQALKEWGFFFPRGEKGKGEARVYGPRILNPIIGSSSGAFTAICAAMGYTAEDLFGDTGRIKAITEEIIKDRLESDPWSIVKRLVSSRQKYTRLKKLVLSKPGMYEHFINTYYPIWKMDKMEKYIRDELLKGRDFDNLKAQILILAVAQEQRLTFIFGDQSHPQKEGQDYKYQKGVPLWKAVAGSMSLPPYYQPYRLENPPREIEPKPGKEVVLIDGESRDAFAANAAEDSGADLIIVSSFYRVLEYSDALGHIDDYGILPVMWQESAQKKDARKLSSMKIRAQKKEALKFFRQVLEKYCPGNCEEEMKQMERALSFRENVDIIEIQAQNYKEAELMYPYWDPFSINRKVLELQYKIGREVATKELKKSLKPLPEVE